MKHISLFNRTLVICFTSMVLLLVCFTTTAQVKVGDNPNTIKSASLLELESTDKGLVLPRVSLSTINTSAPLNNDILEGTIVYNTNTAFVGGTGLQIWTGSTWKVVTPSANNFTLPALTNGSVIFSDGTTLAQNNSKFFWDNINASLGIGNASPKYKLDVKGIGSFTAEGPGLLLQGANAGSHTYVEFYPDGPGSNRKAWLGFGSNGSQSLSIVNQISTGDMGLSTGRDIYLTAGGGTRLLVQGSTGNIGIGNTAPSASLHVKGSVRFENLTNGVLIADATGNLSITALSAINGNSWSLTGNRGTDPSTNFIGTTDAQPLVFKVNNQNAGKLDNVFFNTSLGYQSLNIAGSAKYNTATGYSALSLNTADGNTATGYQSLNYNTSGFNNTAIGNLTLKTNTTGSYNTAIGNAADVSSNNLTNATAIGYNAKAAISNSVILGNATDGVKVGIGTSSPTANLHVNGAVRLEDLTNGVLTADANGNLSTTNLSANSWSLTGNGGTNPSNNFIGTTDEQPLVFKVNNEKAGRLDYLTAANTSFGYQSLNAITSGASNTAIGYQALFSNTSGQQNIAMGSFALTKNVSGNENAGIGAFSLLSNTTGNLNTANGSGSLSSNSTGVENTAIGSSSLRRNSTGNNNTAIGSSTLLNNSDGNNNTALGSHADVSGRGRSLTNATAIGYNAKVAISNAIVLGNTTDNVSVGIGTSSPTSNLHVKGSLRFENLINGVLTVDAAGNLSSVSSASLTTASNGLTQTGANIALGGTLTQATTITQNSNDLVIQGAGTLLVSEQIANMVALGGFKSGTSIGQSFTLSQASTITSITIHSGNSIGAATLKLFNGNGSAVTYSQAISVSPGIKTYILTTPQSMPAGVNRFEVAGSSIILAFLGDSYAGGGFYQSGNFNSNEDIYFIVNYITTQSSPTLFAGSNGNVGVGTSNPGHPLTVQATSSGVMMGLYNNNGTDKYNFSLTNGGLNLSESYVAGGRIFVKDGGNVGIGTETPGYKLDVNGGIRCIGAVVTTSDARLKKDIQPINRALPGILGLRGVRYNFRRADFPAMGLPQGEQIGLLAQEVEKIFPELVSTDDKGYKAVNYAQLTPVLIEAVKEQQTQIESVNKQNDNLKKENASIKQDVETLKAQMKILLNKMAPTAQIN